jgi:hypothetical protein
MSTLYIQIYIYIYVYIVHNSGAINVNASKPAAGSSSSKSKVKSKLAGKRNYMYYIISIYKTILTTLDGKANIRRRRRQKMLQKCILHERSCHFCNVSTHYFCNLRYSK